MGRPFALELSRLPATYKWALELESAQLEEALSTLACGPLIATGSGGSLTAAHLAAALHQQFTGQLAKAVTPMELQRMGPCFRDASVMLFTAGGRNSDIIRALESVACREPKNLVVICGQRRTPLSKVASKYKYVNFIELQLPFGKDGFLATNSLLAFCTIITKGYAKVFEGLPVPPDLTALVHPTISDTSFAETLQKNCKALWQRDLLIVLHSPDLYPAAADIESKFTEAALGATQISDFRNFGHGRHHWLAKKANTSAVLALISPRDKMLAHKTLALIPKNIPVAAIDIPAANHLAALASIPVAFRLAALAGAARGIDPGRPGVPQFGRKLYHLRGGRPDKSNLTPWRAAAIERKTGKSVEQLSRRKELDTWSAALDSFVSELRATKFGAIVLDYDGTLCTKANRFSGVQSDIQPPLIRLLDAGFPIAIATGRGKSVRAELRKIIPERHWPAITIGYYNGAQIGILSDDRCPVQFEKECAELEVVATALRKDIRLMKMAEFSFRDRQITVEAKAGVDPECIWEPVQQLLARGEKNGISVVRSTHSVDVLASRVSKRSIVEMFRVHGPVLAIGDQGLWPGNDFQLLQEPCSLSVNETSRDPRTCWNIAPPGYRGVQATASYLESVSAGSEKLSLNLKSLGAD